MTPAQYRSKILQIVVSGVAELLQAIRSEYFIDTERMCGSSTESNLRYNHRTVSFLSEGHAAVGLVEFRWDNQSF